VGRGLTAIYSPLHKNLSPLSAFGLKCRLIEPQECTPRQIHGYAAATKLAVIKSISLLGKHGNDSIHKITEVKTYIYCDIQTRLCLIFDEHLPKM